MGIYLNPGKELFERAVNSNIYVDKSGLLEYTNHNIYTENCFMAISRPRRFGKTMAMNMMCAYYGKNCDSGQYNRPWIIDRNLFQLIPIIPVFGFFIGHLIFFTKPTQKMSPVI